MRFAALFRYQPSLYNIVFIDNFNFNIFQIDLIFRNFDIFLRTHKVLLINSLLYILNSTAKIAQMFTHLLSKQGALRSIPTHPFFLLLLFSYLVTCQYQYFLEKIRIIC